MPRTIGEIEINSPLGQALIEHSKIANTIVEVGTGSGLGSTQCLLKNKAPVWSIEACPFQAEVAYENLKGVIDGIHLLTGAIHNTIRPYFHPQDRVQDREAWEFEDNLRTEPLVHKSFLPTHIGFLFLDGGEFTSDGDFLALWQRCSKIALDDCNPLKAIKNVYAYNCLKQAGWYEYSSLEDRNGWAIFTRP